VVRSRYTKRPFPPYSYVPGQSPHPVSDPAGHMFGQEMPKPPPLDPANWRASETYLYSIDLFNHGYYWEAHETWESLWHAAGRKGVVADFLKGLIKLAAAGVKMREGNVDGVRRHMKRADELLTSVSATATYFCGLKLLEILAQCRIESPEHVRLDIGES
jgi:hypothetical protein